jgi:hypothetical protein
MTQTAFQMDIHNMERRYGNAVRNLLGHQRIPQENKEKILQFVEHCQAQDLSLARRLFYLQRLTKPTTGPPMIPSRDSITMLRRLNPNGAGGIERIM